jgi:hypothetical protein
MTNGNLIDGRAIADQIHLKTTDRIAALKAQAYRGWPSSALAKIRVESLCRDEGANGPSPPSLLCHTRSRRKHHRRLLDLIEELNRDRASMAFSCNRRAFAYSLAGFTRRCCRVGRGWFSSVNMGKLLLADMSGFVPCTPAGVQELLIKARSNRRR